MNKMSESGLTRLMDEQDLRIKIMNTKNILQFEKWILGKDNPENLFIRLILIQTMSWQSWRAATRNPVEALRYE
jgi:hypothetical protein